MSSYTSSEREDKKYTVRQAIASARARYKRPICLDSVPASRNLDEKITLEELNQISDAIVSDSAWWDYDPR